MSQSIIYIIYLISDISVGNFDSDCESESQSPIFTIKKKIEKSLTHPKPGKYISHKFPQLHLKISQNFNLV